MSKLERREVPETPKGIVVKSEGSYSGFATSCCGLEAGQGRDNLSTATSFGSLSFRGEGIELSRSSPYATPLTPHSKATFRSKENLPQPPAPHPTFTAP